MTVEIYKINYPFNVEITEKLKRQVIQRLKLISPKTALGFGLKNFSGSAHQKTDLEFKELLTEILIELQEGPHLMKKIIGVHFDYFRQLLF